MSDTSALRWLHGGFHLGDDPTPDLDEGAKFARSEPTSSDAGPYVCSYKGSFTSIDGADVLWTDRKSVV